MALCYGGGPLRRSEGVWKICPARSEAEDQQDKFLARTEQRRFFGSFLAAKRNKALLPEESDGYVRSRKKTAEASRQLSATFSG